jgi:hypothetical protein
MIHSGSTIPRHKYLLTYVRSPGFLNLCSLGQWQCYNVDINVASTILVLCVGPYYRLEAYLVEYSCSNPSARNFATHWFLSPAALV